MKSPAHRSPPRTGGPKPTEEQQAVMDAIRAGVKSLKVEAGAGTGKSTTATMIARTKPRERGILTVFNRLMADSSQKDLVGTGCRASTLHSIAYRSGAAEPYKQRINMRLPARLAASKAGVTGAAKAGDVRLTQVAVGYLLINWVARYCQSADDVLNVRHFPRRTLFDNLNVEQTKRAVDDKRWFDSLCDSLATGLIEPARRLWTLMSDPSLADMPSSHDVYLKLYVMGQPTIDADYVILDEAQDANPIMQQYMALAAGQGAQAIYVGDSHQQLYSWRGAVDAMKSVHADASLPLTHSFRFGPPVAEVANAILGSMIGTDFQLVGAGGPSSIVDDMDTPSAVICRTNAAAIETALALMEDGVKCGLCMDPQTVKRDVDALERFAEGGQSDDWRFCHFMHYGELREACAAGILPDFKILVDVIDAHGFAEARELLMRLAVGKSMEAIRSARVETMLLTGHASKGLQFDHVLLGDDFQSPKTDEEMNILYVAATRARKTLCLGDSEAADEIRSAVNSRPSA
ncbi:hypothetical protein WK76_24920 [Burkholderia ubonensis]|uniref:UvrD-helicase domain-containing protein n=1 Tax=Burkholderia ubonensis TaxID=101571 RepID=UPI000757578A|nr:UvrD-helicase domain-containing protein [Burkholderia ubonensis]KVU84273.1 hypothetical protein WK76_24920 [Burkholderia ubonensis]